MYQNISDNWKRLLPCLNSTIFLLFIFVKTKGICQEILFMILVLNPIFFLVVGSPSLISYRKVEITHLFPVCSFLQLIGQFNVRLSTLKETKALSRANYNSQIPKFCILPILQSKKKNLVNLFISVHYTVYSLRIWIKPAGYFYVFTYAFYKIKSDSYAQRVVLWVWT